MRDGAGASLLLRSIALPRRASSTPSSFDTLAIIHPNAAGLDIGSREIVAALPPDRAPTVVRACSTCTPDVNALVDGLVAARIATVVRESTGVSGVPISALLAQRGLKPVLVNARHVKIVPGRKRDWHDAPWLQKLHSFGLFAGSFRPDAERVALRTRVRHRGELIPHRSPHLLHMLKALTQMNMQRDQVLSDSMGTTGQAIVRAIVAGERDPVTRAQRRNPAGKASRETIAKALTGRWQDEHRCVLTHALARYDASTEQVVAGDAHIERTLQAMASRGEPYAPLPELPRAKPHSTSKNQPRFNARAQVARIIGGDLVAVTGVSAATVQTIISEMGTDVSRFPTGTHVCSWLGRAPHNDSSGGKVVRSRIRKVVTPATQAFRQAAPSVARSDSVDGAFFRSMRARVGPPQATVATAHTLARTVYHMRMHREAFRPETAKVYDEARHDRELRQRKRRAERLGFTRTPNADAPSEIAPQTDG